MLDRNAFEDLMGPHFDLLREAVGRASREFATLPRTHPFIARSLSARRGRPNLLHDLIWTCLVERLGESPDAQFMDDNGDGDPDPTKRELSWFNGRVRMRVKQHRRDSLEIRSYPTSSARAFMTQGTQLQFDLSTGEAMTPTNVALGYTFSEKMGRVDGVVISARVAPRELAWLIDLGDPAAGSARPGTTILPGGPVATGPPAPKAVPRPVAGDGNEDHQDEEEARGS